jgi:hypothetical protein
MTTYQTIQEVLEKVIGEANTPELRAKVTKELEDRLKECVRIKVICDETTNPPSVIYMNELRGIVIKGDAKKPEETQYRFRISSTGINVE